MNFYVIVISCFLLQGQESPKKNMEIMKKWKLTEFLDLNESQAEKFFPKMNVHEKEMKEINGAIRKIKDEIEKEINNSSSSSIKNQKNIKEIEELEHKKIDLRFEYFLSLKGVLEPVQVSKLLVFDRKFKRTLKDQLKKSPDRIHHKKGDKFKKDR